MLRKTTFVLKKYPVARETENMMWYRAELVRLKILRFPRHWTNSSASPMERRIDEELGEKAEAEFLLMLQKVGYM